MGRKYTEEEKKRMSIIAKERGYGKWMVGKHHTEISKQKLVGNKNALGNKAFTGKRHSLETIQKIIETKRRNPYKHTNEEKRKISESGKGRPAWNKGTKGIIISWNKGMTFEYKQRKPHTQITKDKQRKSAMIRMSKGIAIPPHYKGEQNPCWKGGLSFEPYTSEFNKKFKEIIRERDNRCCQMCNLKETAKRLAIHHINYDKTLSIPQNCISLCEKCHGLTNWNREEWISFFHSILSKKYGYGYQDDKIILEVRS